MVVIFSLLIMTPAFWLCVGLVVGRLEGARRAVSMPQIG